MTYLGAHGNPASLDYYRNFCTSEFGASRKAPPEVLKDRECPAMLIPSTPLARRCFPAIQAKKGVIMVGNKTTYDDGHGNRRNVTDLLEGAKQANVVLETRQLAMKIFEDYTVSWYWIIIGLVIAMVASLIFIVLLRFLAGIMVWVMIVMVILVLGYGIFHCYMEYAKLKGEAGSDVSLTDLGFQTDLRVYLHLRQTWLAFLIILCVLELVIVLLLVFLRKRILIAIALIKEASRAVGHVMSSLLFPLCTFFLLCLCIAYWASTAVFLSTSNEAVYKVFNESACPFSGQTCKPETFNTTNVTKVCSDAQCLFAFYGGETAYHKYLVVLQFFNVFMFFWLANFVIALGQVTLAGAFASYYWAFKKPDDMPAFPLFSAFGRALRYHTGSLAFGSLVLAVVQVIRVTLEYLDHRLKAAENKFAKFLLSCLKCCFWCLEKFIKFLNRNAYIMIAIYGTNFCTSARNAFFLLMRNIIRVAVLDKVTDFLFFLGKLLIVGSVGILAFFFFTQRIKLVQDTAPPLNYYWVPILVSRPVIFGVTPRDAPRQPPAHGRLLKALLCGRCFPGAMSPLLVAVGAGPALPALASTQRWLRPFVPALGCSRQSCPVPFSSFPTLGNVGFSAFLLLLLLWVLCWNQRVASLADGDRGLLPHRPRVLQRVRHVRGHPLPLLL
uniref:Choline transporter-like protein n=1 Tax=Cyanoderma ruficeps TaxID=181631 RepID=A0A8C3QZE0_9PASS